MNEVLAAGAAIATHPGAGPTTYLVALSLPLLGAILLAIVKLRPAMRKIEADSEAKLIETLSTRVAKLEQDLAAMALARDQERTARDIERAQSEATLALMRHRANNADQCIDALLMMLETSPDRVPQAIALVKELRARQREAEAIERAGIHGASIAAKTPPIIP